MFFLHLHSQTSWVSKTTSMKSNISSRADKILIVCPCLSPLCLPLVDDNEIRIYAHGSVRDCKVATRWTLNFVPVYGNTVHIVVIFDDTNGAA